MRSCIFGAAMHAQDIQDELDLARQLDPGADLRGPVEEDGHDTGASGATPDSENDGFVHTGYRKSVEEPELSQDGTDPLQRDDVDEEMRDGQWSNAEKDDDGGEPSDEDVEDDDDEEGDEEEDDYVTEDDDDDEEPEPSRSGWEVDEEELKIYEANKISIKGHERWTHDEVRLHKLLSLRGLHPLMPAAWSRDFLGVPIYPALFAPAGSDKQVVIHNKSSQFRGVCVCVCVSISSPPFPGHDATELRK